MKQMNPESLLSGSTILLGVTGSIAAYKAAELTSRLTQRGGDVVVIMTSAAREFITPLTFESLSGNQVFTDLFSRRNDYDPIHISLAERADVVLIAPGTAHFIGKMAGGLADDLLSSVVMATRAPVIIAPAMNSGMYDNPLVRENIRKLSDLGVTFVGPESGHLACGSEGLGRLAAVDAIFDATEKVLR